MNIIKLDKKDYEHLLAQLDEPPKVLPALKQLLQTKSVWSK